MTDERCPVCGAGPVGQPEYIFDMAVLADMLRRDDLTADVEADSQKCMRYGYRDAAGHKWRTSQRP